MPIVTSCPQCDRKVRVPDELLDRNVRCPSCRNVFVATAPPDAPQEERHRRASKLQDARSISRKRRVPVGRDCIHRQRTKTVRRARYSEEEDEDFPESDYEPPCGRRLHEADEFGDEGVSRSGGNRAAWLRVSRGLTWTLVSISIVVGLACMEIGGGFLIGVLLVTSNRALTLLSTSFLSPLWVLAVIVRLIGVAVKGMDLYGHFLGMSVPNKPGTNLKHLAIAKFGLNTAGAAILIPVDFLTFALGISNGWFANPFAGSSVAKILQLSQLFGGLLGLAGFFVFILYLRGVAIAVKRKQLGNQVKVYLITVICSQVVAVLMVVMFFVVQGVAISGAAAALTPSVSSSGFTEASQAATGILGCLGGLIALALAIWYVVLLVAGLRGAVLEFARRG